MKMLKINELEREPFRQLGDYQELFSLGGNANEGFFPDFMQIDNSGKAASFSICRVGKQEVIKNVEYHANCYEGILPLDGDIYIMAGPSHWFMQLDAISLFRIPKGTLVKIRPGVLHGSPISCNGELVNVLITLPERTYANDCVFVELEEKDWMSY